MDQEILTKIGLTNNEVKIYLNLLEMGSTPAGDVIKKSGLHRTAVYDILERLIEKGLASYVMIGKIKHFEVIEPNQLLNYIDQRKNELEDNKKELEKIIPELNLKKKLSKSNTQATLYKGKKAIKTLLEDVLNTKSDFYVYGAEGNLKKMFPIYYIHFHNKRIKKNINLKIIYSERVKLHERNKELKKIEIKYLPNEFETPATTWIYGDKIVIVVWDEQPIATLIRNKEVAKAYLSNFNLLWKMGKK
jgi:HTH-type transcriptional regulator, sugar sensing transcriptional regulator